MRRATAQVATRVVKGARTQLAVRVWYGTASLGSVPVVPGSWQVSDSDDQQVPGELRFDVPDRPEWRPTSPAHPLAGMGQRAVVHQGVDVGNRVEWLPMGVFRLSAPTRSDDVLSVSGAGMLAGVERARLLAPYVAPKGATRAGVLGALIGGMVPWRLVGVTDEKLPSFTCERERLEGVREIIDGWPARLAMTDSGVLEVRPPYDDANPGPAVVELVDGPGGTLVSVVSQPDTASMFNGYSVSTQPEGDQQPVTESWVMPSGPLAWSGPYGQFPGFFTAPSLPADRVRLRAVAQMMTLRAGRRRDAYEVTAAPDPRVQVGDVAHVRSTAQGIDITGRVTQVTHTRTQLRATVAFLSGVRV